MSESKTPTQNEKPPAWHVLHAMRSRLDNPLRWTQGRWAASSPKVLDDVAVATDERATCWCLAGALIVATGSPEAKEAAERWLCCVLPAEFKNPSSPTASLVAWNDDPARTHEDVLALLDEAMAWAEAA